MAIAWVVAASAIAVIALLDSNGGSEPTRRDAGSVATQLARVQRRLEARIDELDRRLGELPSRTDVQPLESRLGTVEDAQARVKDASDGVSRLEDRVSELEQQSSGSGGAKTP